MELYHTGPQAQLCNAMEFERPKASDFEHRRNARLCGIQGASQSVSDRHPEHSLSLSSQFAGNRERLDQAAAGCFPIPVGSGCLPGPPDCSATDAALGLPSTYSSNPAGIVPGLLINPNVALLQSTAFISQAWYNSFQLHVEHRLSHGFYLGTSFTWQKAEDTSSGSFAGDNFSADATPTIPWWDLRIVKGPADFNVGRNLVINTLWNIPTGSLAGPLSVVAKGWQVGGIVSLSDGVPIWPLDGLEGDLMGQLNGEPLGIPDLASGCTPKNLVENVVQPGVGVGYLKPQCFINAVAPSLAFYNAPAPLGCDQKFRLSNLHQSSWELGPQLDHRPRVVQHRFLVGQGYSCPQDL